MTGLPSPAEAMRMAHALLLGAESSDDVLAQAAIATAWIAFARELREGRRPDARVRLSASPGASDATKKAVDALRVYLGASATTWPDADAVVHRGRLAPDAPHLPGNSGPLRRLADPPERATERIERELQDGPPDTAVLPVYRNAAGAADTAQMPAVDVAPEGYDSRPCPSCGHTLVLRLRADLPAEWPWPDEATAMWVHFLSMRPECQAV